MTTPRPQASVAYVRDGKLTPEGLAYFLALAEKVAELEARILVLEAP